MESVNRANNGNVYKVGWSRILYSRDDILNVRNFLESRGNVMFFSRKN